MKIARLVVLGVALTAGGLAAYFASSSSPPPAEPTAPMAPVARLETDDILIASADLPLGKIISDADLTWQAWPSTAVTPNMIRRNEASTIMNDLRGAFVRVAFSQGDPIRREKIIRPGSKSGFLSAILPSGARAVAINIDTQGGTTAGGFILPNDRVDVLKTGRDEEGKAGESFVTETILTNIRVLAIGQNIQEKNGEKVVVGSNATLEVDARQAELLVLAQRVGQLSLSLRSMADILPSATQVLPDAPERGLSIVRYGVPQGGR
ncbi:MAG: Flp pilus assembly protein CpaB [Hyphomicrobiales bacterium]|nr:Flp pilus assembly protein CpaB [Hyphomicrobiales bacterium]